MTAGLMDAVTTSTAALDASIESLSADEIRAACALPTWTRGHLITHLARNADALRHILLGARTGHDLAMYPSREARDEDIRVGALRSPATIVGDSQLSNAALTAELRHFPPSSWDAPIVLHTTNGPAEQPATAVLHMRLREVEIHHVDLLSGHDFGATAPTTLHLLLEDATQRHAGQLHIELLASDTGNRYNINKTDASETDRVSAEAPAAELLAYLTGRSKLAQLPPPPAWG